MIYSNILIFHYREFDKYPPILNLLNYLRNEKIDFKHVSGIIYSKNRFLNLIDFIYYSFRVFCSIVFSRNSNIIYFESISAFPVYCYFIFFPFSKKNIYIHYHEYFDKNEQNIQSFLERLGRRVEHKLFNKAIWISHTNKHRLDLFHNEFPNLSNSVLKTLPNYPPLSWHRAPKQMCEVQKIDKIKLVHIGALSTNGMYLENVLDQFGNNPKFTIDFYSHKFTTEISALISSYSNCTIKGSIAYQDIPTLKGLYDIGLVLYKALSTNVIYCAPNKVFEYLALDLDVWCSDKLISANVHERLDCYPKMIMVDYESINVFNVEKATDKLGLEYVPSTYVCEPVYEKLLNAINENTHP